ncbi:hypothetical protein MMC14_005186 [Varicellaria rhodocarpa]|nr:hypothetical protein [Varicellaria rhodocarpa]
MSRLFPHSEYAEDQPLAHTLLATHVIYRGFQSGAVLGLLTGAVRCIPLLRSTSTPAATLWPLARSLSERSTGVGAAIGAGSMLVGLPARMWGRQEIEWKDRSWRLLENKGQMEVDDWSLVGTVAGAVIAATAQEKGTSLGWRSVVGGSGMGSLVGVMGYMGWRHGIKGGKWD